MVAPAMARLSPKPLFFILRPRSGFERTRMDGGTNHITNASARPFGHQIFRHVQQYHKCHPYLLGQHKLVSFSPSASGSWSTWQRCQGSQNKHSTSCDPWGKTNLQLPETDLSNGRIALATTRQSYNCRHTENSARAQRAALSAPTAGARLDEASLQVSVEAFLRKPYQQTGDKQDIHTINGKEMERMWVVEQGSCEFLRVAKPYQP